MLAFMGKINGDASMKLTTLLFSVFSILLTSNAYGADHAEDSRTSQQIAIPKEAAHQLTNKLNERPVLSATSSSILPEPPISFIIPSSTDRRPTTLLKALPSLDDHLDVAEVPTSPFESIRLSELSDEDDQPLYSAEDRDELDMLIEDVYQQEIDNSRIKPDIPKEDEELYLQAWIYLLENTELGDLVGKKDELCHHVVVLYKQLQKWPTFDEIAAHINLKGIDWYSVLSAESVDKYTRALDPTPVAPAQMLVQNSIYDKISAAIKSSSVTSYPGKK